MACALTIRFLVKSFRTLSMLVSRCLIISFEMSNTDVWHGITTIQYFWSILITSSPTNSSCYAHQYWGVPKDSTKILISLFLLWGIWHEWKTFCKIFLMDIPLSGEISCKFLNFFFLMFGTFQLRFWFSSDFLAIFDIWMNLLQMWRNLMSLMLKWWNLLNCLCSGVSHWEREIWIQSRYARASHPMNQGWNWKSKMYPLLLGHLLGMVISVTLEGQASFYIFGYLQELRRESGDFF